MTDFAEIHPFCQLTVAQTFNSFRQLSDHIWSSDVREDFSSEVRKCLISVNVLFCCRYLSRNFVCCHIREMLQAKAHLCDEKNLKYDVIKCINLREGTVASLEVWKQFSLFSFLLLILHRRRSVSIPITVSSNVHIKLFVVGTQELACVQPPALLEKKSESDCRQTIRT